MKNITLTFLLFVLLFSSCKSKSDQIENKLIGKWVLASTLSPRGGFYKSEGDKKVLTFFDKASYSFEWWNGDVGNKFNGSYFIVSNPNRKLSTIAFIPDLQISQKDTVRTYMNYDIISISDSTLKVVEETQFIPRKNQPYLAFTKQYIYKRHN